MTKKIRLGETKRLIYYCCYDLNKEVEGVKSELWIPAPTLYQAAQHYSTLTGCNRDDVRVKETGAIEEFNNLTIGL